MRFYRIRGEQMPFQRAHSRNDRKPRPQASCDWAKPHIAVRFQHGMTGRWNGRDGLPAYGFVDTSGLESPGVDWLPAPGGERSRHGRGAAWIRMVQVSNTNPQNIRKAQAHPTNSPRDLLTTYPNSELRIADARHAPATTVGSWPDKSIRKHVSDTATTAIAPISPLRLNWARRSAPAGAGGRKAGSRVMRFTPAACRTSSGRCLPSALLRAA
jgi:hypothetical protein